MARTALLSLGFILLLVTGCPSAREHADENRDVGAACTKVGQSCEFSPGKLGTCVQLDECASPPCYRCQSQH